MEETFVEKNITDTPFGEESQVQQAAHDLRVAAGEKAKKIAHDAGAKAQHLKQSAAEKAQQFRDYAGEKAGDFKETASARAQHFKQVTGEQVQHGRVKAREVQAETEEYIRQNPAKAVLTALGVGLVVGLVIRR